MGHADHARHQCQGLDDGDTSDLAKHGAANEGHIINMGSTAGIYAYAGAAVYSATKAAVKTFSDGLRIDTIATDIKVTTIQPGIR